MIPVVILAGGLATRLRPITERIPKSLIEIEGTPFLFHQLRLLEQHGVERVHFCLGYLGEMIEQKIMESSFYQKMSFSFSYDGDTQLGTGGAVRNALPFLPETFFITYGDSYLDISYQAVERHFDETGDSKGGLMTVYRNGNEYDTSNVIFKKKKILLYSKKIRSDRMEYIDYGLGILRKCHFEDYDGVPAFDLSEIYEKLSKQGLLAAYEATDRFFEIGSQGGIKDLSDYLKNKDT